MTTATKTWGEMDRAERKAYKAAKLAAVLAGIKPAVGMGATSGYGSDCYAYTIVEVAKSGKKFWMTADSSKVIGGPVPFGVEPKREFTSNPDGERREVRATARGWVNGGVKYGASVGLDYRREYRDPSF
jgi:hypothetical protein